MDSFITELNNWYQTDLGHYVSAAEQLELDNLLPSLVGYFLVQIGGPNNFNYSSSSFIAHHTYVITQGETEFKGSTVISNLNELPFVYESVDVVVLPHVIEFLPEPKKILNEIYNILIPGGTLILIGFNPLSLWGLAKFFRYENKVPWNGKFYSALRVGSWLQKQGFRVDDQKTFCFRPPVNKQVLKQLLFLESVGQLCWPYWGGCYMLIAKKESVLVKPVKSTKYRKIPITSGYPEPSGYK